MKNKGFTLVELLAVIVILAVISLIATPMILGVIETAKQEAAKASALNYIDAVEKYMIMAELDPENHYRLEAGHKYYVISNSTIDDLAYNFVENVKALEMPENTYLNDILNIKGEYPSDGYVLVGLNNKVENAKFNIKDYIVSYNDNQIEIEGTKKIDNMIKSIIVTTDISDYKTLEVGDTFFLNVTTIPSNAEDKEFTYLSGDESILDVNNQGMVTVVGIGNTTITVTSKNEVRGIININMISPAKPVINGFGNYPLITEDGITYTNKISITYDSSRSDLINYYSMDGGIRWLEYQEPFNAYGTEIMAKSVVKETFEESEVVTCNIALAGNALQTISYDNIPSTYISSNDSTFSKYIEVSPEMIGKFVRFSYRTPYDTSGKAYSSAKVTFIDSSNTEFSTVNMATSLEVPEGTTKMKITLTAAKNSRTGSYINATLSEISV